MDILNGHIMAYLIWLVVCRQSSTTAFRLCKSICRCCYWWLYENIAKFAQIWWCDEWHGGLRRIVRGNPTIPIHCIDNKVIVSMLMLSLPLLDIDYNLHRFILFLLMMVHLKIKITSSRIAIAAALYSYLGHPTTIRWQYSVPTTIHIHLPVASRGSIFNIPPASWGQSVKKQSKSNNFSRRRISLPVYAAARGQPPAQTYW